MKSNGDIRIIQTVLKGNVNVYEELITKYCKKLGGYIMKQVKDQSTAQELVQEVFIKAYSKLEIFDQSRSFSVWLFSIARNTVIDYYRQADKITYYSFDETFDIDDKKAIEQNPVNILLEREKTLELGDLINDLPCKYRELILLKYFEELSYEEIANRLNISHNKVKWRLHQARKALLKAFEEGDIIEGRRLYGL